MPAAKSFLELLDNVTSGHHLAAALRASGDVLALDAERVEAALKAWRQPIEAELVKVAPEAEKKKCLDYLRRLLDRAPADFDWMELGAYLALSLSDLSRELRRNLQSATNGAQLWPGLAQAVYDAATSDALLEVQQAVESFFPPKDTVPEWVQEEIAKLPKAATSGPLAPLSVTPVPPPPPAPPVPTSLLIRQCRTFTPHATSPDQSTPPHYEGACPCLSSP